MAGAVAIPRGPGAAGLNRRGLRTPRPKLSTGQPHARPAWRGNACVWARGGPRQMRGGPRLDGAHERTTRQSCEEFTWCPASPPDSPRGQWCCSPNGLPTVGGERVHGSCGVASQPPATAGWWPPTFATMMHRDPAMPVAAFRLTGSVSGFHDSALVSVMVHVAPDAPNSPAPSMARERLWVCAPDSPRGQLRPLLSFLGQPQTENRRRALARRTPWLVKRSSLVVLFPERPAAGRQGAGSQLVFLRGGLTAASRPPYCRAGATDLFAT